jgi:hypothetical protein
VRAVTMDRVRLDRDLRVPKSLERSDLL